MNHDADTTRFDPPGPGGWKRLADHFPDALTPEYQRLYAETAPAGMAIGMERHGVLARSIDVGYVHGHLYITPVPIAGPREIRRTPPVAAVWLLSRLHPEFRRRTRSARRALTERPWRAVAAHWFETERFEWERRNTAIQDIDVTALDDRALAEHLRSCRAHLYAGYRRHFELHGDDLLPVGLLIARCAEWGIDATVAMRALDGASPESTGTTTPPDWQLVTGYDLDNLAWCELPSRSRSGERREVTPFDLRQLVETADHDELDGLVADARAAVPLRDDNGALTGAWPMGLLRRAMLETGRRLGCDDPTLAIEATVDELVGRLAELGSPSGSGAPSGSPSNNALSNEAPSNEVLRERQRDRAARSALDAPLTLGPDFAIPPMHALPRPLALIGAAQLATVDHMVRSDAAVGVGTRCHTGRALVVDDPVLADAAFEPGDVVITSFTSPSWNAILAEAGAIVTTTGGLVSHAAVFARELGIPAVLGDTTATKRFTTGDLVTVDPVAGTVVHAGIEAPRPA
ncbi:MAG: PEP-utilizing enzyme [Acidimicrobiales bacterium]